MNAEPSRLSALARRKINSADNDLFLSAASVWEIAIKYSIGKLPLPAPPGQYVPARLAPTRTAPLAVELQHALKVSELPHHHSDPFDRMLVAQAQIENLALMTADEQLEAYDIQIIRAY